jgi:FMN phosphatase YigB (HAD superfamily)
MHIIKIAHVIRTRRIFSVFLLLCIGLAITTTIKVMRAKEDSPISPKNLAFVFDIDDVLLKRTGKIGAAIWKYKKAVARGFISPSLWAHVIVLLSNGAPVGQYQALFKEKRPELVPMVDEIAHQKEPIEETVAIVKELHAAGYTLHLASNMGKEDFEYFKKQYPELFSYFKTAKVISYSANPKEKPIKKPNLVYFFQLCNELKEMGENKPTKVFIDDQLRNVTAAEETKEFLGIVYKNSSQLREELCTLGALTAAQPEEKTVST